MDQLSGRIRKAIHLTPHLSDRVVRQGRQYLAVLGWLMRESIVVQRAQWRTVFAGAAINLVSNAAVVSAVYTYVRLLESDAQFTLGRWSVEARDSVSLLVALVLVVAAALLAYSYSEYRVRATALRLGRLYEEHSFRQLVARARGLPDQRNSRANDLLETAGLRKLALNYAHYAGWSLRFIANAIPSLVMFVFALASLVALDAAMTVVVLSLGVLVVGAQYPANILAANASSIADANQRRVINDFNTLADELNRTPRHRSAERLAETVDAFYEQKTAQIFMQANEDRFRAMEVSALTTQAGGSLVLVAILAIVGSSVLKGNVEWAVLVAYVALMRLMLGSITQVFRGVTVFSRFYPYTKELYEFRVGAGFSSLGAAPSPLATVGVKIEAEPLVGANAELTLRPGTVVALWTERGYGRDLEGVLLKACAGYRADTPCEVLSCLATSPGSADEVLAYHEYRMQNPDEDSANVKDFPFLKQPKDWWQVARRQSACAVLIDSLVLDNDPEIDWKSVRDELGGRVAFIVYADPFRPSNHHGESVLLIRGRNNRLYWRAFPESGLDEKSWAALRALLLATGKSEGGQSSVDEDGIE